MHFIALETVFSIRTCIIPWMYNSHSLCGSRETSAIYFSPQKIKVIVVSSHCKIKPFLC